MLIDKQVLDDAMRANGEFGMKILRLLQMAYELNRAVRQCNKQPPIPPFDEAGPHNADNLLQALIDVWSNRSYEVNSEMQHDRWVYAKLKEGWTYGPVEDPEKKQHPNLVPFDQLPWTEKIKDAIFLCVAMIGKPTAEELGLKEESDD